MGRPQLLKSAALQIAAMYDNCLKLATDNKITKANTWDLRLIDHISNLITDEKVCSSCAQVFRSHLLIAVYP